MKTINDLHQDSALVVIGLPSGPVSWNFATRSNSSVARTVGYHANQKQPIAQDLNQLPYLHHGRTITTNRSPEVDCNE